uniref:G-protein coupled receptors family 1 profile domain-containing protein n=1 Tax=Scophthalmus maximus TaxID=52904 RepID=A0A8D3DWM2_SCOMX
MENQSLHTNILLLEGLKVNAQSSIAAFIFLLLMYGFIMVSNMGLVLLISRSKSLQQPMYLLFCNMSVNDVFGASIIIPRVLRDIFTSNSDLYIHYIDCVVQAFCVHLYGTTSHTVLMIMAFDRRVISNLFCDHASLFKLSCESVVINQVYGLGNTVVLLGSSICSVTLTYLKIAAVCIRSKNKVLNRKALQTCATHLAVYVLLLVSAFIVVILHRFPQLSYHRKVAAILGEVALPALNAVIYGLQIKEVRQRIVALLHSKQTLVHLK